MEEPMSKAVAKPATPNPARIVVCTALPTGLCKQEAGRKQSSKMCITNGIK